MLMTQTTIDNAINDDIVGRSDSDQTIIALAAVYNLGSKASLRAGWKNTETDVLDDDNRVKSQDDTQYALGIKVDF